MSTVSLPSAATATTNQQGAAGGGAASDGSDGGLAADVSAGNGLSSSITGAAVTRAGGGGGGSYSNGGFSAGGTGGGGGGGSDVEADAHSGVSNGNGFWYPASGTDNTGRDVFARLIDGYRISISFAIIVTTLSYIIGVLIGGLLGYLGGKFDLFGVRLMEVFSAVPFLFTMILGSFMQPSILLLATMAVLLRGWIGITYFIRGEFFREKARDYVSAAVSMGASNFSVMYKHILPNSLTPIITFVPFSIIGDACVIRLFRIWPKTPNIKLGKPAGSSFRESG